jgi:hypothetical protein
VSFLLAVCALQDTLYHSFFQHLLARLPGRLADHVVGLLGNFATGEPVNLIATDVTSIGWFSPVFAPGVAAADISSQPSAQSRAVLIGYVVLCSQKVAW